MNYCSRSTFKVSTVHRSLVDHHTGLAALSLGDERHQTTLFNHCLSCLEQDGRDENRVVFVINMVNEIWQ
jgi:hypothetical protein